MRISEELIVEILHLKEISCAFSSETKICSARIEFLEFVYEILCYFSQDRWPCVVPVVAFCSKSGPQGEGKCYDCCFESPGLFLLWERHLFCILEGSK